MPAPKLTRELLEYIADDINSPLKKKHRAYAQDMFLFYQGNTKDIIRKAIQKEFKKPETLEELMGRLLPLNLLKKITDKLAMVYLEKPIRNTLDGSEGDEELLAAYLRGMRYDARMKECNRYFKLFKSNLQEIYVNEEGIPGCRNIPRHQYEVYSFGQIETHKPNVIVKILKDDFEATKQELYVMTDDEAVLINGKGELIVDAMNPNMVNPYGKMPYIYLNEATYSVNPIQDDDSLGVAIIVPVLLTDLLFAAKYQCFSVIYTIGVTGDIPFNPSSVVQMDFGRDGSVPQIGTIKPDVDSDKIVSVVETILAIHLSNKGLSVGTFKTQLSATNISGVSKVLDSAESIEDRKDQQDYFQESERETWRLISRYLHPYWRSQQMLAEPYNKQFSPVFDVSIQFREPKVMMSDLEKVDLSKARHQAGFSTLLQELKYLYPYMSEEEINQLAVEIETERTAKLAAYREEPADELESEVQG